MKIEQVTLTFDTILEHLGEGNVYLIRDNRDYSSKLKNSGRLTLSQLKHADIEDLINRLKRGEHIPAIKVEG